MRVLLFTLGVFFATSLANALTFPKSLKEKVAEADTIIRGTVLSVTQLMPERIVKGVNGASGTYTGAYSMAVVKVEAVWKNGKSMNFIPHDLENFELTTVEYILVPCDYGFDESPSDVSAGSSYVLFLRKMGANIYHPLNCQSTYLISDDRVAHSGFNHPRGENWTEESQPLKKFKSSVDALLNHFSKKEKI